MSDEGTWLPAEGGVADGDEFEWFGTKEEAAFVVYKDEKRWYQLFLGSAETQLRLGFTVEVYQYVPKKHKFVMTQKVKPSDLPVA